MNRRPLLLLTAVVTAAVASFAPVPTASPILTAAPASAYHMGTDPRADILAVAARHLCGGLNQNQLAAMAMAVTFPETGAGDDYPPSPMTMGRSDSGEELKPKDMPTDPDRHQPYWHPGVGMFQMDTSGLGANHDAAWAINVGSSAEGAIIDISSRYCSSGTTGAAARDYAWGHWFGCNRDNACEVAYQSIMASGLTLHDEVTSNGGMVQRTCTRSGASFPCWYVNPALAQGFNGWTSNNFGPSPIADPFYVFTNSNGAEERHWIEGGNDKKAVRPLGLDARTAAVWGPSDITASTTPPPPALPPRAPLSAGRDYNGDGHDDILWIGPEDSVNESLWWGLTALGSFANGPINGSISGDGLPLAGDFNGDDRVDFIWYQPGSGSDLLWLNWTAERDFLPVPMQDQDGVNRSIGGRYTPAVGDFNGDGFDDIYWYGVEGASESLYYGRSDGHFTMNIVGKQISRTGLVPIVGDYDGDGQDDIYWYSRTDTEALWQGLSSTTTQFANSANVTNVSSPWYQPVSGDFNGDAHADIYWYQAGTSNDSLWTAFGSIGDFSNSASLDVNGNFLPVAGDYNEDTRDDIFWYGEGAAFDSVWYWNAGGGVSSRNKAVNGTYLPT